MHLLEIWPYLEVKGQPSIFEVLPMPNPICSLHFFELGEQFVKKTKNLDAHFHREIQNILIHVGINEALFLHPLFSDISEMSCGKGI